jgi:hypothetical protein
MWLTDMKEEVAEWALHPLTSFQFHSITRSDVWELNRKHIEEVSVSMMAEEILTTGNFKVSLIGCLMFVEKREHCNVFTIDDGMGHMVNIIQWQESHTILWDRENIQYVV